MYTIEYAPTPKQRMFHGSTADEILYGGAAGGGKGLVLSVKIPTINGMVRMGDISVGDMVFGLDGNTYPVTKVIPLGEVYGYEFTFDDGSTLMASDDHLWHTYTAADLSALSKRTPEYRERRRKNRPSKTTGKKSAVFSASLAKRNSEKPTPSLPPPSGSVKTTEEIVATLRLKSGRANHAIPVTKPIQLPEREFELDPYLLGLWLGDGCKSSSSFVGIDGLEQAFADGGYVVTRNSKYAHSIHGLVTTIRKMGLYKNKHIPEEYFWSSESQRLALLQGLMDTDGNCNLNGSAEFVNTNKSLVDGAAFLIRSLGMKCSVRESRAKLYGKDCGPKWSIKFVPSLPVFRMKRKLSRQTLDQRRTTKYRYIVKAERLKEPVPMRCISIDSPDHLYLAGESFIPTHNSKAIVMDAFFRCVQWPGTHAYIFRRTYGELEDTIIKEAKESYPQGIYKYNGGRHEMSLLNGSVIHFRHCSSVADMYNYKGSEIQWLYFDELTTFEYEIYDFIKTRLRAKKKFGIIPCVRSASNPGDIGHGWVKKMFVDAATPMQIFKREVKSEATGRTRTFRLQYIPSLLTENPHIGDDYLFQLEAKPKALRDALLFGNWDAFEGQVFIEWVDLVNKNNKTDEDFINLRQRTNTHVIRPKDITIPVHWPRYMSFDYGYSKPFSVGWWAIAPDGCAVRYREWYGCEPGRPNTGIQFTPRQIAEGILEREVEETANNISVDRVADPSIFDRSRGDSVAQQMEPMGGRRGVYFRPGDNTRAAGKSQIHERLRFVDGRPMMQVLSTCKDFIRTIPTLPYSMTKVEDVDTDAEDHIYDETRYFCMARPLPIKEMKPKATVDYDPFRSYRRE